MNTGLKGLESRTHRKRLVIESIEGTPSTRKSLRDYPFGRIADFPGKRQALGVRDGHTGNPTVQTISGPSKSSEGLMPRCSTRRDGSSPRR